MLTKTELQAIWGRYGFRPEKRLGQNFLIDKNIKKKIVANLDIHPKDIIIEIGPGFGELTSELAGRSSMVYAIEIDKRICEILRAEPNLPQNLTIVRGDFLNLNIKEIAKGKKTVVYGNLPYYITSPIIEKIISEREHIKCAYLVTQAEVAERIVAQPNSKRIGRLSLFVQQFTDPRILFKIKKGSFYPTPQVDSAFIRLEVLEKSRARVQNEEALSRVIKIAYGKRRKTIFNALKATGIGNNELLEILKQAGVEPRARAENLSLEDFRRISDLIGS